MTEEVKKEKVTLVKTKFDVLVDKIYTHLNKSETPWTLYVGYNPKTDDYLMESFEKYDPKFSIKKDKDDVLLVFNKDNINRKPLLSKQMIADVLKVVKEGRFVKIEK